MNARRSCRTAFLGLCLGLIASAAPGDNGTSVAKSGTAGSEFQVNSYTTSFQGRTEVAVEADGDFVVVWESIGSGGSDSAGSSVHGQRYASDGSTAGGQFQVNSYTTNDQRETAVAVDADGDFVVVWRSVGSGGTDSDGFSIQGQRYASDGSAVGGQFQVNSYTTNNQYEPAVAMDADGGFVVVWESDGSVGTDSSGDSIQGQRYASDGSAVGGQFQVNSYTSSNQLHPAVAVDADGDFVVAWHSFGSGGTDSSSFSVQGQRYASDGSADGGELQVNTYTTANQWKPAVAVDADGDFVVVWESDGSASTDSAGDSIQGQRYASDGSAVGGELQVNSYTTANQENPAVAVDADGDFVMVWESDGSGGTDSSDASIQGQRYASDGSTVGGEFQVNSYTSAGQSLPDVALDGADGFVVAWQSSGSAGTDSSSLSVQAQRYALAADLSITKDDGLTSATPGDTLVYTIVASNPGPDTATSVSVTDTFPAGLTCDWTSFAVGGATGNTLASSGDLDETLTMPADSSVTYSVACDTDPSAEGLVVNTATISSPITDPVPGNNSASDTTAVPAGIFADGFESGDTSAW